MAGEPVRPPYKAFAAKLSRSPLLPRLSLPALLPPLPIAKQCWRSLSAIRCCGRYGWWAGPRQCRLSQRGQSGRCSPTHRRVAFCCGWGRCRRGITPAAAVAARCATRSQHAQKSAAQQNQQSHALLMHCLCTLISMTNSLQCAQGPFDGVFASRERPVERLRADLLAATGDGL